MNRGIRRGGSMLTLGLAVLAYNLSTGEPVFRLLDAEEPIVSGAINSPLLSYVFAVVFVAVGAVVLLRSAW